MQAAVDAARAAHEQAEATLLAGSSEDASASPDESAPASHGWPELPGSPGAVRQPSPSGTAFDPVITPAPRPWAGRQVRGRMRQARGPRGPRVAGVAALAVILVAAFAVGVVLAARGGRTHAPGQPETRHSQPPGAASQRGGSAGTAAAGLAASWVDRQVSHDASVACDKAMCAALAADGFPARRLALINPGAPYPSRAQVMVETPIVRRLLGVRRSADRASPVLVRFGQGYAAISVRVVTPQGAAAYQRELKADVRQRRGEGAGLLASSHVSASAAARKALLAGRADARLIVVLTAIASVHPIDILRFGTDFPGTSPGLPLRTADLALDDRAARLREADYVRFLLTVLDAEPDGYRPLIAGPARAAGTRVFQITFAAPSPLKLLG